MGRWKKEVVVEKDLEGEVPWQAGLEYLRKDDVN